MHYALRRNSLANANDLANEMAKTSSSLRKWKFTTKFASDCECDGLVHSEPDHPLEILEELKSGCLRVRREERLRLEERLGKPMGLDSEPFLKPIARASSIRGQPYFSVSEYDLESERENRWALIRSHSWNQSGEPTVFGDSLNLESSEIPAIRPVL